MFGYSLDYTLFTVYFKFQLVVVSIFWIMVQIYKQHLDVICYIAR